MSVKHESIYLVNINLSETVPIRVNIVMSEQLVQGCYARPICVNRGFSGIKTY